MLRSGGGLKVGAFNVLGGTRTMGCSPFCGIFILSTFMNLCAFLFFDCIVYSFLGSIPFSFHVPPSTSAMLVELSHMKDKYLNTSVYIRAC